MQVNAFQVYEQLRNFLVAGCSSFFEITIDEFTGGGVKKLLFGIR